MLKTLQFIAGITLLLVSPVALFGQLSNITDVTLTFTPVGGGAAITATANDPDGDGAMPFQVAGAIELTESTEYNLTIDVQNSIDGVDQTTVIQQNANDYLFFFAFTDQLLTSPAGDGNIDSRFDPMNYTDADGNGLPVGLTSDWESECDEIALPGNFRVVLQHQPGIKSDTTN
ncbi:MAG: hypothetical protein AAFU67_11445, partial [Bacteroidota bacterium]